MSTVIRLSSELVEDARIAARAELRSVPKQIEYWARLGRELEKRRRAMSFDFSNPREWAALPGAELVEKGLGDAQHGRQTAEALLVSIVAPRLERLGLGVQVQRWPEPELALYRILAKRHGDDAHSKYNSLIRRLNSFANALACATL